MLNNILANLPEIKGSAQKHLPFKEKFFPAFDLVYPGFCLSRILSDTGQNETHGTKSHDSDVGRENH